VGPSPADNYSVSAKRRIISDPTAAKVNFARSSFGRARMPSPSELSRNLGDDE
jgi:hypothetical protein